MLNPFNVLVIWRVYLLRGMLVIDDSTEMVDCVNITVDEVLVLNTYILVC